MFRLLKLGGIEQKGFGSMVNRSLSTFKPWDHFLINFKTSEENVWFQNIQSTIN